MAQKTGSFLLEEDFRERVGGNTVVRDLCSFRDSSRCEIERERGIIEYRLRKTWSHFQPMIKSRLAYRLRQIVNIIKCLLLLTTSLIPIHLECSLGMRLKIIYTVRARSQYYLFLHFCILVLFW